MVDVTGKPDLESYLVLPDDVDLTNCDREAIDVPGAIQPHGALLLVDPDDGRVAAESTNAATFLGLEGSLVGRPVAEVTGSPELASGVSRPGTGHRSVVVIARDGRRLDAVIHAVSGMVIVELEPAPDSIESAGLFSAATTAGTAIGDAPSLAVAQQRATDLVSELTGFDRVMLYMFHPDGHGEVVAETTRPGVDSFLGLHFPATDIPRQARLLYTRSWTRLIADAGATPVPLRPATHPGTGRPVNLALAQLRAVSPIHLEYLANMGVGASFSLSLVSDGELVGLVACHHATPRHLPYAVRSVCELIARLLSEELMRANAAARTHWEAERQRLELSLLRWLDEAGTAEAAMEMIAADGTELFEADGFVGRVGDAILTIGETPLTADDVTSRIADTTRAVLLDRLGDRPGGALVVPLANAGDFLCWYRQPYLRTITWGGDPTSARAPGKISPRRSFAAWSETISDSCRPWTDRERELATSLLHGLHEWTPATELRSDGALAAWAARVEQLEIENARLRGENDELMDFVAVAAHDLRAPLRAVSGLVDAFVGGGDRLDVETLDHLRSRIVAGTEHMRLLLDGMLRWSRLTHDAAKGPVDLRQTLETVVEVLRPRLEAVGAVVEIAALPIVTGDGALLRELFQNLVDNAVKYRDPGRPLAIVVTADWSERWATISVADNGVGIARDDLDRAFRAFEQLDAWSDGVGLGLSIVERIAHHHGGSVRADSRIGTGTVFHVELPIRP